MTHSDAPAGRTVDPLLLLGRNDVNLTPPKPLQDQERNLNLIELPESY